MTLPLYYKLTAEQKKIISIVIQQYIDANFDMKKLGVAVYDVTNIVHHPIVNRYGFYFHQNKSKFSVNISIE